jgi:hypothetical protein
MSGRWPWAATVRTFRGVRAVAGRGLAVLRAFSADQPAMTLSEVARTTR